MWTGELDTGLEKEADSDVDFDTEREEMLGYLTKENLFSDLDEFSGRETGNDFLGTGGGVSQSRERWKALQGSEAISKRHWWENLRKIRKA